MRATKAMIFYGTPDEWRTISGSLRRNRHAVTARNIESSVSLHRSYNGAVPHVKIEASGNSITWIQDAARQEGIDITTT